MRTLKSAGFSLIEVMIVVAIIAIVAAYAYPSYQDQVSKSQRTEGQAFLLDAMAKQERYYSENNSYTNDLADLGYTKNGSNFETENAYYFVVASACGADALTVCVELTGTGQGPLADTGGANDLSLNSRNVKTGLW